jgi:hypothetical protein
MIKQAPEKIAQVSTAAWITAAGNSRAQVKAKVNRSRSLLLLSLEAYAA